MSASVHPFPCAPTYRFEYIPPFAARELAAIERWRANAQAGLAALPGCTLQQQRALGRIADELRDAILAELQGPQGA
jgi:hypothetical protein